MKLPQFNSETLNIFTDASVVQVGDEYIGCSGAVAYVGDMDNLQKVNEIFKINRFSTNNNSEIKAIYLGIMIALQFKNQVKEINLFSDSKICIYGLREWIRKWTQNSGNGPLLIGSTNKPVSNQQDILNCVYTILNYGLHINLYHQKGHVENASGINNAIKVFKGSNLIENKFISHEYMECISSANCYVDNMTRDVLKSLQIQPMTQEQVVPVQLVQLEYHPFDVDRYLGMVTN